MRTGRTGFGNKIKIINIKYFAGICLKKLENQEKRLFMIRIKEKIANKAHHFIIGKIKNIKTSKNGIIYKTQL
jgi:hypothetical protein